MREAVTQEVLKLMDQEQASADETIAERGKTHGPYIVDATLAISIIELYAEAPNWKRLAPDMKHSLIMQAFKSARILCGDETHADHWHDIQGYARLVEQRLVGA